MSLEIIVQKALESAAIKTASETPISNNSTRSRKLENIEEKFIEKACHAIRETAKTDYKNLSASYKAYVQYNNVPTGLRNKLFIALFGE